MIQEHWRICTTLKDGTKYIQSMHFGSYRDCYQYLLWCHHIVVENEFVDFIKDHDARIYPLWRANRP